MKRSLSLLVRAVIGVGLGLGSAACSSNTEDPLVCETVTPPAGAPKLLGADCDPLVPTQCGYPFPSNVWLTDDTSKPTGKRVAFGAATLPVAAGRGPMDPEWWASSDGFSPGQPALTHLPGATITGLPTQDSIELSLSDASPTVILDAETGERVPHFSELDRSLVAEADEERAFLVRPVVRLADARRYIVAIRNVVDTSGKPIAASPAFQALRDGAASCDPSVEARRGLYDDIFARLEKAGISRKDLQIAWDFTTASRENNTAALVAMRDDALMKVGAEGPEYTLTSTEEFTEAENPRIWKRLVGMMKVPLYLEAPGPGSSLVRGDDGLPKQNGFAEYEFVVHVPHAAKQGQKLALIQNGHGLLGSKFEGGDGYLGELANRHGYVAFSVDLVGMASEDVPSITDALVTDAGGFRKSVDRQHQGILNSLLAMRMMSGRFVNEPLLQVNGESVIDPTQRFYRGDSQGGIFGTTYMALSTDVTRGLLSVPGMPYTMLLDRSTDFAPFFLFLKGAYGTGRNIQLVEGLMQMLWDRTEPSGYAPYIRENMLPGTPAHDLLIHVAIGDYQVTPLGAHILARAVGAKNLTPVNRTIWGVDEAPAPLSGAAIVEYDFGLPEAPKTNTPPKGDDDPHGRVRGLDAAYSQSHEFFRTGVIKAFCEGACDPE
ncbi:hypothetical protein [Polyangium sorediatum]|uniref:Bacterial virulence factor lipase N-terminal domain-containing protein n=1 Tax=Polyangium sorediatum TaxID=889274 RepID=A0ABT6P395_9BACT|nr:hypothetical protein [Polyangium sorediatum]MDI1435087.1 hypothetical protein [Polyangium sorediatum]